jgi:hypothetical protein
VVRWKVEEQESRGKIHGNARDEVGSSAAYLQEGRETRRARRTRGLALRWRGDWVDRQTPPLGGVFEWLKRVRATGDEKRAKYIRCP